MLKYVSILFILLLFSSCTYIKTAAIDQSIRLTKQKKINYIRLKEPIENLYIIWPTRSAFIKEYFGGEHIIEELDPKAYRIIKKLDVICAKAKNREFTDIEYGQGAALFLKYEKFVIKGFLAKYAPKILKYLKYL